MYVLPEPLLATCRTSAAVPSTAPSPAGSSLTIVIWCCEERLPSLAARWSSHARRPSAPSTRWPRIRSSASGVKRSRTSSKRRWSRRQAYSVTSSSMAIRSSIGTCPCTRRFYVAKPDAALVPWGRRDLMGYAEQTTSIASPGAINEHASALAYEWRRLTRAATTVALFTAPACFLVLYDTEHFSLIASILLAALGVLVFRGIVEVVVRKWIPWPSLWGAEDLKEDDLVARRRYWYWRTKFRRLPFLIVAILVLLALCQALFAFSGVSASFFHPFAGLRQIFPPDTLPQLALVFVQLPLLLFINVFILFGPFLFMAARGIRSYEPGDASWGVRIDDVRGQAEAKEEITRVITLWQSGEEFERAGGKRERGLLFLGAPGTGKTMISKAIATNFNCPFVTIPGSGFAGMFIGMDAITVQFLAHKARKLAKKWGGQCIVFIDEIDAVGTRRQALGGMIGGGNQPSSIHDVCFHGPDGALTPSGDLVIESRAWRERLFAQRAESTQTGYATFVERVAQRLQR